MKLEEKTIFRQLFCLTTHLVISSCGACCIRNRGTNYKVLVICKTIFQSSPEVKMRLRQSELDKVFSRFTGSLAPLQTAAVSYHLQTNFGVYFCTEWGQNVDFVPLRKHWSEDERSQQAKPVSVYTRGAWLLFKDTLEKTVNPSRQSAAVILTAAATPGENCRGSRERKWWNLAFGCWWEQDRFFINITRLPESAQKKQTYLSRVYSVNLYLSVHEQNAMTTIFLVFFTHFISFPLNFP